MSFSAWEQTIEETFIQPLHQFRSRVTLFNELHNDCMNRCSAILGGLLTGSDGQPAFQGSGAHALANVIGQFFETEQQYAGSSEYLIGRLADASTLYEQAASKLQQRLEEIAAEAGTSSLVASAGELAVTADVGAVAQGGLDVPWDIIALGATAVALFAAGAARIDPDTVRAQDAQTAFKLATVEVNDKIDEGPVSEPIPDPPPGPSGPPDPQGGFNKLVIALLAGLAILGGVAYVASNGGLGTNSLPVDPDKTIQQLSSADRKDLIDYLMQAYGCSAEQIQAIMKKLGVENLTSAQLELIIQALQVKAQLEELLSQLQHSSLNTASLQKTVRSAINKINAGIKNGTATKWIRANLEGWQQNLKGPAYQWQAAQALGATQIETPLPAKVDVIGGDGTWYEVKSSGSIRYGNTGYKELITQLEKYVRLGAPSVGVVLQPGIDPDLLQQLQKDLAPKGIFHIKVIRLPYTPPSAPGGNWCSLP